MDGQAEDAKELIRHQVVVCDVQAIMAQRADVGAANRVELEALEPRWAEAEIALLPRQVGHN